MIETLLLVPLVILPIGDLVAAIFFTRLFLLSKEYAVPGSEPSFLSRLLRGRSWLLGLLAAKCLIVTVDFSFIGWLAFLRLLGRPVEGVGAYVILALAVLGAIPIIFMAAFWRTRKKRGGSPPPFGERD